MTGGDVVVDASAMAAVMLSEAGGAAVEARLRGATLHAPRLLAYELASAAVKRARKEPDRAVEVMAALAATLTRLARIHWYDVQATDVALLARATGLSAYDAAYMWLAGWLGADLVTLDDRLQKAREPGDEVNPEP
jgi:predicted nucleic acid-binding protein